MSCSAGRLAAAVVVLSLVVAGAATPAAAQSDAETTVMQISLQANGDARWTVSTRFVFDDANESSAFTRVADEYVNEEVHPLNVDPFRSAAELASEETGRPMSIHSVDRAASQGNDTGELRLSFTWTNFTRVSEDGSEIHLGDVFATPSGTWLPRLGEDQVLVIQFPSGYDIESVSHGLDNRSIRVNGPATFEPGEPSATMVRGEPIESPGSPNGEVGVPSALTAGAALAILLLVAYTLYRRRQSEEPEAPEGEPTEPPEEATSAELLSDEERVLRLLRAEGGRMKQVDIVEETDWSNAKVSQLLSSMAESGQIEKLRIGRENLISLPDDD